MSLQDSLFSEEIENDVTIFFQQKLPKRVLIFPPVNNYRRFLIHQIVQDNFSDNLSTFSIGQGSARRTVVCYKSDIIRDPKLNGVLLPRVSDSTARMGVEDRRSPSASPENSRNRQMKSTPAVEIYRPPAARRAQNGTSQNVTADSSNNSKATRQKRPDRAVYVPKHRRSTEVEGSPLLQEEISGRSRPERRSKPSAVINSPEKVQILEQDSIETAKVSSIESLSHEEAPQLSLKTEESPVKINEDLNNVNGDKISEESFVKMNEDLNNVNGDKISEEVPSKNGDNGHCEENEVDCEISNIDVITENANDVDDEKVINDIEKMPVHRNLVSDVLIISTCESSSLPEKNTEEEVSTSNRSPEKKPKKVARAKSKPASPPSPPIKLNRDECDWDSLFDDNGDCLDPTLIEELSAAVGEVRIEQPKNDYKAFSRPVEVSSDEFAHVIEIYNFPSDYKTSDLAAVFSPFKNGGFELKWVDDTHCLGVFSSPLVAAEVLASDHPFVKTRPLSEATALSRTKARRSAEFLQPYRSRPETCAALARRLVTGALGVKLATARQEREREKVVLREAKERKRLANKQRDDAWEGIITPK